MGPPTIARDRFDYDKAVTTSWKRMMLLNLVKLRYGDTPMFLDVASIINSYSLEAQISLGAGIAETPGFDTGSIGGAGRYADKPTITYNPLLGERFTRSLMTPLPPGVVVSLIQSGWAADAVMQMMVSSVNGVQNRFGGGARARGADPEFQKICATLRRIQASGVVGMRVEKTKEQEWAVMTLHRKNITPELQEDIRTLRGLLGIRHDAKDIRVVYGSAPQNDEELAMVTRSFLEILIDTAASIEVPESHVGGGERYQDRGLRHGRGRRLPTHGPDPERTGQAGERLRSHTLRGPLVLDREPGLPVEAGLLVPDDHLLVDGRRPRERCCRSSRFPRVEPREAEFFLSTMFLLTCPSFSLSVRTGGFPVSRRAGPSHGVYTGGERPSEAGAGMIFQAEVARCGMAWRNGE